MLLAVSMLMIASCGSGDPEAFCVAWDKVDSTVAEEPPTVDADEIQSAFEQMENAAPGDLKDDVVVVNESMSDILHRRGHPGFESLPATDGDIPWDNLAAIDNVEDYIEEHC